MAVCSPQNLSLLEWQLCRLEALSAQQLYGIFSARESVFVVEQNCPYQELDGLDFQAEHLIAWANNSKSASVAAYLRILPPETRFTEPSLGRVLTTATYRGLGIGRALMEKALHHLEAAYPEHDIRISAQVYLEKFYGSLHFKVVSDIYMEDDIPHVEMVRAARV